MEDIPPSRIVEKKSGGLIAIEECLFLDLEMIVIVFSTSSIPENMDDVLQNLGMDFEHFLTLSAACDVCSVSMGFHTNPTEYFFFI